MDKKSKNRLLSFLCMGVLSAANVAIAGGVSSSVQGAQLGTEVATEGMDVDTYGVTYVGQKAEGGYVIESVADGFQSQVCVRTEFDADGETIHKVTIVSQEETSGIGSKIAEDTSFSENFTGVQAPVRIKEMEVSSPGIESQPFVASGTGSKATTAFNPASWNSDGHTPEAEAVRNLYTAGLLGSAEEGRTLETAFVDMSSQERAVTAMYRAGLLGSAEEGRELETAFVDLSPQERAVSAMYRAGLLGSAEEGRELETALVDLSPEERAAVKMQQAGLLEVQQGAAEPEDSKTETITATAVDGISGATVSSSAAARAVNNAYFFVQEVLK